VSAGLFVRANLTVTVDDDGRQFGRKTVCPALQDLDNRINCRTQGREFDPGPFTSRVENHSCRHRATKAFGNNLSRRCQTYALIPGGDSRSHGKIWFDALPGSRTIVVFTNQRIDPGLEIGGFHYSAGNNVRTLPAINPGAGGIDSCQKGLPVSFRPLTDDKYIFVHWLTVVAP